LNPYANSLISTPQVPSSLLKKTIVLTIRVSQKHFVPEKFLKSYGFNSLYELLDVDLIKKLNSDEKESDLMYPEENIPQKKGVTTQIN
jgi:hypothetical protein